MLYDNNDKKEEKLERSIENESTSENDYAWREGDGNRKQRGPTMMSPSECPSLRHFSFVPRHGQRRFAFVAHASLCSPPFPFRLECQHRPHRDLNPDCLREGRGSLVPGHVSLYFCAAGTVLRECPNQGAGPLQRNQSWRQARRMTRKVKRRRGTSEEGVVYPALVRALAMSLVSEVMDRSSHPLYRQALVLLATFLHL
jgi:hypothetical protein